MRDEEADDPPRATARRVLAFLGLVGIGLGAWIWLQRSQAAPRRRPATEQGRPVRVLSLAPLEVVPRTIGYGEVEAQREWQALAEVAGVVELVGDGVEVGRVVEAGTVLLRIDPQTYALEQTKSEASLEGVRAQIAQLQAQERSAAANMALEQRGLDLARKDLDAAQKLYDAGNAPMTDVETAQKAVLAAEKAVQGYKNTLSELPANRKVLQAQLEQQEAGVEGTRLDLAKTEIVAPFTMRLREVDVSLDQVVASGQVLLIGDGIDVVEIPARIPVGSLGPLLPPRPKAGGTKPEPEPANEKEPGTAPAPGSSPGSRFTKRLQSIQAVVRLETQGIAATWLGNLRRLGGIDAETRNLIAVVQVDDTRAQGKKRGPPLTPGLYVEVELRGAARPGCLAVPPSAYHDGVVYVAGEDDRLELREVTADLAQEAFVCVSGKVQAGDRVVLTELAPAVAGMLLDPRPDDQAATDLAAAARPEGASP